MITCIILCLILTGLSLYMHCCMSNSDYDYHMGLAPDKTTLGSSTVTSILSYRFYVITALKLVLVCSLISSYMFMQFFYLKMQLTKSATISNIPTLVINYGLFLCYYSVFSLFPCSPCVSHILHSHSLV